MIFFIFCILISSLNMPKSKFKKCLIRKNGYIIKYNEKTPQEGKMLY